MSNQIPWKILIIPLVVASSMLGLATQDANAKDMHFRCEAGDTDRNSGARLVQVQASSVTAGDLVSPMKLPNRGSWQFDGRSAIVYAAPSNTGGYAENFTWEGFFLSPSSNKFQTETGIADRLVTQFAYDKGNWTRLSIGLVADRKGAPRLSIELEGFDGRSFGLGDRIVAADRWHHFALVHEGTASAAKIRWYLDYKLAGELFLGGQSNQNTLRPPGGAPFTIGARLLNGQQVNRGFEGFIDEVRLVPRPMKVDEFQRCDGAVFESNVDLVRLSQERHDEHDAFWLQRHRWARQQSVRWSRGAAGLSTIDAFFAQPATLVGDAAFLRRLSLTVRGRIPSLHEVERFLDDARPDKRSRVIDRFLASPEWADGWVGYWQDVLAENPSVVFPTLNNSGAFRQWIYESFRDNIPFDRFATELILMESSGSIGADYDGPAAFALATGNDAPMAMRAHVAMKAFAAVDLKCARCHDSPIDDFRQSDLFLLAAYLNGGPLKVPASSVAAIGKAKETGTITTSLKPGQTIEPAGLTAHWLSDQDGPATLNPIAPGSRAKLAALMTSPRNPRFSDVIANRMWQRCFGTGLIEPVDDWSVLPEGSHVELLRLLSAEFVNSGYDLKHLARRILNSDVWQTERSPRQRTHRVTSDSSDSRRGNTNQAFRIFNQTWNRRLRMSAEQLVDSLFVAAGKDFRAETLGVHATDPGAVQLPKPRRAWQFAALPNERDRPALGMPVSQTIVDVMTMFGWNGSRQSPRSQREQTTSALQPLMLFNGLMSQRIVRLSEQSAITELCLQEVPLRTLVDRLFLTVLGRRPDNEERRKFENFLRPGYPKRSTGKAARPIEPLSTFQPDWRKHLEAEQTRLMLKAEHRVARGEQPTVRLTIDFRKRVEDVLWALINSPEFVVIP